MLLRVCHPYAPIVTAQKMPLQASIFLLVLRGYYFDTETKLYFLKTRYYDPEVGRFMTIDGIEYLDPETINGLNLYAYCGNNPVMNVDTNGSSWWSRFWNRVGGWLRDNLKELAIGAAFIIGGAVVTFFTESVTKGKLK